MQTQAVMARYRELCGHGLTGQEAPQVRREFQEKGQQHLHRLHERCWCGFLTVPASCYTYDDKGQTNTQEDAEKAYLATLNIVVQREAVEQAVLNTCGCGNEIKGRGKKCPACYQRAYRERSRG